MELKETACTIRVPKTVCKESEERAVDMDLVLPDYCPDVTAVLKCTMQPLITSGSQSGDRYNVDGVVKIRILYVSEDRTNIHCYETSQPFHAGFRCTPAQHYHVDIKQDYVHCRANSPKRIGVHGAFRVLLHAVGEGAVSVYQDPCCRGIYCQEETVHTTVPVSETAKTFLLDETIHLGINAERVLYVDFIPTACERKILTNKVILKGCVSCKIVAVQNKELHTILQEIPFSQILDINGLNEEFLCEAKVAMSEYEYRLEHTENGSAVLLINAKLNACVRCSCRESADVVIDAYSVEHPLICETTPLKFEECQSGETVRKTFQEYTSLPEGVVTAEDQWAELKTFEIQQEEDRKYMACCILLCLIGRDRDGHIGYYERTIDYKIPCEDDHTHADMKLIGVSCTVQNDRMRVSVDAECKIDTISSKTIPVVTHTLLDTKQSFTRNGASIRIVYAEKGERLWDIAKMHHACVQDIRTENDLSDDCIQTPSMLMIPIM